MDYPSPIEPETLTPNSKKKGIWYTVGPFIKFFGSVAVTVIVIQLFVVHSYFVSGMSMYPTLSNGDRLIISKLGRTTSSVLQNEYLPKRGEIVVFDDPYLQDRQLIKRVIGLPGDRVILENGSLIVYNDEYPSGLMVDDFAELDLAFSPGKVDEIVPEGEIFVSGDNRTPGASLDSRNDLGTVPLENVIGNLVLRVYPLGAIKVF